MSAGSRVLPTRCSGCWKAGAYFQNLYATRNVNVACTLMAGDASSFASPFYVGCIHKNALRNSLKGDFEPAVQYEPLPLPTGIGQVVRIPARMTMLCCQNETWWKRHAGERYCFSCWAQGLGYEVLSYCGSRYRDLAHPSLPCLGWT
mgnify:CR=1 FL=1